MVQLPATPTSTFSAVVYFDLESIGTGVSNQLKRYAAPPRGHCPGCLPDRIELAELCSRKLRDDDLRSGEPREQIGQRLPEFGKRWERAR